MESFEQPIFPVTPGGESESSPVGQGQTELSPKTEGETELSLTGQEVKPQKCQKELKSSLCKCISPCNRVEPELFNSKGGKHATQIIDETKSNITDCESSSSGRHGETKTLKIKGKARRKRNWEVFPGGNKFCCDGRFIRGPNCYGYLFTLTLILIIGGLYFGYDGVYLSRRVSPVIPAIGMPFFLLILALLNITSFSDPGIIPRANKVDIEKQELLNYKTDTQGIRFIETEIKGRIFNQPYCRTCKIYRPLRSSHCSKCDNCVERFDHHCPFVSNCIGKRNYKYFYALLISATIMACYVIGCNVAVTYFLAHEYEIKEALLKSIPSLIEGTLCFVVSVTGLFCLAIYHSLFVCRNETTNEWMKDTFDNNINPFSKGNWYSNCYNILCTPKSPSIIDTRGFVITEDSGSQKQSSSPPVLPS